MSNSHKLGVSPDATEETDVSLKCSVCGAAAGQRFHKSTVHDICPACLRYNAGQKPKRTINALRALDYRKRTGGRWQRCSRCHAEHELTAPVLYNVGGQQLERSAEAVPALMPLMLAQDLLGFICGKCFYSTCQHIVSIFPDAQGFPHVDRDGMLVPTPRCECGTPLHYSNDGRELLCAQCDGAQWDAREGKRVVVDG